MTQPSDNETTTIQWSDIRAMEAEISRLRQENERLRRVADAARKIHLIDGADNHRELRAVLDALNKTEGE